MPVNRLSPRSKQGAKALTTTLISILILLLGGLLVQPRLGQRRLFIDDRHVLTPVEVDALPAGTLPVVLDRRLGQTETSFAYRLLQLVMERSGERYAIGFSSEVFPQDEVMNALHQGSRRGITIRPESLLGPMALGCSSTVACAPFAFLFPVVCWAFGPAGPMPVSSHCWRRFVIWWTCVSCC